MLLCNVPPVIQVLRKHLLCVVDLDSPVRFLGETSDDEIAHSEEQLLVPAHLLMVLAPLGQD